METTFCLALGLELQFAQLLCQVGFADSFLAEAETDDLPCTAVLEHVQISVNLPGLLMDGQREKHDYHFRLDIRFERLEALKSVYHTILCRVL